MKTIGFLFGAGAEFAFNMPSGGQFALDIFRCDVTDAKKDFQQMRNSINSKDQNYAGGWLPSDYKNKRIGVFGKSVCEGIIQDTLHQRQQVIIKKLTNLDLVIDGILSKCEKDSLYSKKQFEADIQAITGVNTSNHYLGQRIKFNHLEKANNIFENKYFNSIIGVYNHLTYTNDLQLKSDLKQILISIIQLLVGALGEKLTNDLNENILTIDDKDDPDLADSDLFDEIGGIFYLDYKSVGLSGLTYLFSYIESYRDTPQQRVLYLAQLILEEIYSSILDYKSLIDNYWHYLYCPKAEWAKFCKISIFLISVKRYIESYYNKEKSRNRNIDCYYSDIKAAIANKKIEEPEVFTTNYTPLITDYFEDIHVSFS